MNVIALTGLVCVEKATLATILAARAAAQGQSALVLDAIARLPIAPHTVAAPVVRVAADDLSQAVVQALHTRTPDVVIIATSEFMHPEAIFAALDALHSRFPALALRIVALIDTRTCDCFPQTRAAFESYADTVIHLPTSFEEFRL